MKYNDPYFLSLGASNTDAQRLTALIKAATAFVETYCGRKFSYQQHSEVITTQQDLSLLLPHPPIDYVARLSVASGEWLTVQNTIAQIANYGVSDVGLALNHTTAGETFGRLFAYTDYLSLTGLVDAINDYGTQESNGWVASVANGYGDYPSNDLVAQNGGCKTPATLLSWEDDGRQVSLNRVTGIIEGCGGMGNMTALPSIYSSGYRMQQVRVHYFGGYCECDFPEDLKEATANLVINAYNNPEGKAQTVTLGGQYSYTLFSQESMAKSDQKVLSYYKDRRI